MARNFKKPTQQEIIPDNFIEEHFLKTGGLYRKNDNVVIEELQMRSAIRDMGLSELAELGWPTKEIKEERTVQHALPGYNDMQTDKTVRITRVPMTPEEAAEFFQNKAMELLGQNGKAPATKKKPSKKAAPKAKSKAKA